ncbi:hypothetical protein D3C71_1972320 [compost metagenome]
MRAMISIAMLLIAGLAVANEQVISVQHDSHRGVTCWILNDKGISCLPDSSLPQIASPSSEAARAAVANDHGQNEQFSTSPLPQVERFQL